MRSGCPPLQSPGPCCITTNTYKACFVPFNSCKDNATELKQPQRECREPHSLFGLPGHHISLHLATQYLLQQTFHTDSSPLQLQTEVQFLAPADSFCGFGQVASPSQTPGSKENNLFCISARKEKDKADAVSQLPGQSPALKSAYTDRKAMLSLHAYNHIKISCCIFILWFCSVTEREHQQLQIPFYKNANLVTLSTLDFIFFWFILVS